MRVERSGFPDFVDTGLMLLNASASDAGARVNERARSVINAMSPRRSNADTSMTCAET